MVHLTQVPSLAKIAISYFWHFFFNCTFSLSVCDGIKDNADSSSEFLLQSVWLAWNCWCILATFGTDYIWVMLCWFSSFWHDFDLVKQDKCAVSRHFHDNVWEEWADICHVNLYLPEMKQANFSTWKIIQLPSGGYPWLLCSQTFLVSKLYSTWLIHAHKNKILWSKLEGSGWNLAATKYNKVVYNGVYSISNISLKTLCGMDSVCRVKFINLIYWDKKW